MNRLIFRTSRALFSTLPGQPKVRAPQAASSKLEKMLQEKNKIVSQEHQEYKISYIVWFKEHIHLLILTSRSNKMERNQLLLQSISHISIPLRLSAMDSLYIFFMESPQQLLRISQWLQPLEPLPGVNSFVFSLN